MTSLLVRSLALAALLASHPGLARAGAETPQAPSSAASTGIAAATPTQRNAIVSGGGAAATMPASSSDRRAFPPHRARLAPVAPQASGAASTPAR